MTRSVYPVLKFDFPINGTDEEAQALVSGPFRQAFTSLEEHEGARASVWLSGYLLDYLSRKHPEFIIDSKRLLNEDRIEVLGGLFYGARPFSIPMVDVYGQIRMTVEFWESFVGRYPAAFTMDPSAWGVDSAYLFADTEYQYGVVPASVLASPATGIVAAERYGRRLDSLVLDDLASKAFEEKCSSDVFTSSADVALIFDAARWGDAAYREAAMEVVCPSSTHEPKLVSEAFHSYDPIEAPMMSFEDAAGAPIIGEDFQDLHAEMIQVSEMLREAIDSVEEEGSEEAWSGKLATAQRALFGAQGSAVFAENGDSKALESTRDKLSEARSILTEALGHTGH